MTGPSSFGAKVPTSSTPGPRRAKLPLSATSTHGINVCCEVVDVQGVVR